MRAGVQSMRGWPQALARLLLPCVCALCGASGEGKVGKVDDLGGLGGLGNPGRWDGPGDGIVCAACRRAYLAASGPRCLRCANPVGLADALTPCAACQLEQPAYDATVAAADYGAPLDGLVLQLKFGGVLALAPWCAGAIRTAVLARPGFLLPQLLCPVPMGPARLVDRGYNQALEIARPLSRALGIPLAARLAIRALNTRAQSTVAPGERKKNIRDAFTVAPDALAMVRGAHIGVVDDVMTSGHTLNELARTFKRFGAARVSNLVFARTPPP